MVSETLRNGLPGACRIVCRDALVSISYSQPANQAPDAGQGADWKKLTLASAGMS